MKEKAIYAPGELSRVRERLGTLDGAEARRMAQVLGGEVGVERAPEKEHRHLWSQAGGAGAGVGVGKKPQRRLPLDEAPGEEVFKEEEPGKEAAQTTPDTATPLPPGEPGWTIKKCSYWERIKMDRYAGRVEFEIKTPWQVFCSLLTFFTPSTDPVSPFFVIRRMNEYYQRIERLVTATRSVFPRNNAERNEKLRQSFPFAYAVLDVIRYYNIEAIARDLGRLQISPRKVQVKDFEDILRAVYRPLYTLELLDLETHIKEAYKRLYQVLFTEDPEAAQEKYQEPIRTALSSFWIIRRDIRRQLYPLLLKTISSRFLPYDALFTTGRDLFLSFINMTEADRIQPFSIEDLSIDLSIEEAPEEVEDEDEDAAEEVPGEEEAAEEEAEIEKKVKRERDPAEERAVGRGLRVLEALFPRAGWTRIERFPDFYPYFASVFSFNKGYSLLSPRDPLHQVLVLSQILEELFFGLRYVVVEDVPGEEPVAEPLEEIIAHWHTCLSDSFDKALFPRLEEYCRLLDNPAESAASEYARHLLNDLHWTRRIYFLPYYRFESSFHAPVDRRHVLPVYPEIRKLRRYLSLLAAGIERGTREGGAEAGARCPGIANPWELYNFQIANPLSTRLDALLGKRRDNASLVFCCLAVTVVLDFLVNHEESWAYGESPPPMFRSVHEEGQIPVFGVETQVNADALFKLSLQKRGVSLEE